MMASLSALSIAGLVYFVCGFAWQGFIGSPGHSPDSVGQGMELDRRGAILLSQAGARWFCRFSGRIAANFLRRPGGVDSARQRRGPLAPSRKLPLDRDSGRLDISAFCALGLGWRLARAARRQLRTGSRIPRCRRSQLDPCVGRPHCLVGNLDFGPSAREIFRGRHGSRDPRPQRSPCHVRLPAGLVGWFGLNSAGAILVHRRRTCPGQS